MATRIPAIRSLNRPMTPILVLLTALVGLLVPPASVMGQDLGEARQLLQGGQYGEAAERAQAAIENGAYDEAWRLLLIESLLAEGRFSDAREVLEPALQRYPLSVRLRFLGREVYRFSGEPALAQRMVDELERLITQAPWRYADAAQRVIVGGYLLERETDPREILEEYYDRAKRSRPDFAAAWIAAGNLALSKHDYALAAEEFRKAIELEPENPDGHLGLARAFRPSDGTVAGRHLQRALELNPRHVPSLLAVTDRHLDAESYEDAEAVLQQILEIHPQQPLAWAYRAVIAQIHGGEQEAGNHRERALSTWEANPHVDHLIGRELSQKYRFAEGAEFQRRALAMDPEMLPARMQLSQDLLRLGEEDEGWELATAVSDADRYNVHAHNLVLLRERLAAFSTVEDDTFIIRMEAREAAIYGPRVLQLLQQARDQLCSQYGSELETPVIVEIFPRQEDFAIRTFGLPGGAGFLGVCFGRVITANSPASNATGNANWEAVMWHEFCHVVTLQKTRNRMPRWLSEGISVYEERLADPGWGQSMTPTYRRMVLGSDLTPVSELSGAFLNPPSPLHLQFAYYESSLVVEYLVETFGLESLRRILDDLAIGMPINEALERHTVSMERLDQDFAAYARTKAEALAPELDWSEPDYPQGADAAAIASWLESHPGNYAAWKQLGRQLVREGRLEAAESTLQELAAAFPTDTSPDCAYRQLAAIYRASGRIEEEIASREHVARLDGDALEDWQRLAAIAASGGRWSEAVEYSQRVLAINPMLPETHRLRAEAAEEAGNTPAAISSWEILERLDDSQPARTHFQLGRLYWQAGRAEDARRRVLMALEEAPRFREAHQLLLEMRAARSGDSTENQP